MKKILVIIFLLLLSNVFALCEEGQIDINSASLGELDNLIWVGPPTAEKIINARPFENVDSLIDVSGIGVIKLADIKEQGLACVDGEAPQVYPEKFHSEISTRGKEEEIIERKGFEPLENIVPKTISLVSQNIKSKNDTQDLNKSNYAVYGFVIFCVLLCFLFILKKFKVRKTEFE
jgi:hypothetical protein